KLNQSNGIDDPMELYQQDPEIVNTQWLFWKEQRRYFYEGQIAVCTRVYMPITAIACSHKNKSLLSKSR
ncbi:MAG: hypothetical protein RR185_10205, partial [Angelakisella sp.]